jgi:hypothetical protein
LHRILPLLAVVAIVIGFANFGWFVGSTTGPRANPENPIPIWITHPLTMLSMAYLLFRFIFPALMGRQNATDAAAREQVLRASGPMLAAGRPRGRIGSVNMSRGLLTVQVFPDGILLNPIFMRSAAILRSEIIGIRVNGTLLGGHYIEVSYTSPAIHSPLLLYASPESDLVRAIEQITGLRLATQGVSSKHSS